MLLQFRQFIEEQLKSKTEFPGLGISVPGLINTNSQTVEICPNIRYLDNKSPALDITAGFNLRTVTIQEEHALCLAEYVNGNTSGSKNFVTLDINEGMGMGVFSRGAYVSGECGFAGEIGHIPLGAPDNKCGCGRNGCLETSATDMALLKMVSAGKSLSMDELNKMVSSGKINIDKELETVLDYLAKGMCVIINLFNPGLILINGRIFDLKTGLMEKLKAKVKNYAMAPSCKICEIKRTSASKDIGALASISNTLFDSIIEQ
jgi:N-acetylglucosamine repressor